MFKCRFIASVACAVLGGFIIIATPNPANARPGDGVIQSEMMAEMLKSKRGRCKKGKRCPRGRDLYTGRGHYNKHGKYWREFKDADDVHEYIHGVRPSGRF